MRVYPEGIDISADELGRKWLAARDVARIARVPDRIWHYERFIARSPSPRAHFLKMLATWTDRLIFETTGKGGGPIRKKERLYSFYDACRARIIYDLTLLGGTTVSAADAVSRAALDRFRKLIESGVTFEQLDREHYLITFHFIGDGHQPITELSTHSEFLADGADVFPHEVYTRIDLGRFFSEALATYEHLLIEVAKAKVKTEAISDAELAAS